MMCNNLEERVVILRLTDVKRTARRQVVPCADCCYRPPLALALEYFATLKSRPSATTQRFVFDVIVGKLMRFCVKDGMPGAQMLERIGRFHTEVIMAL